MRGYTIETYGDASADEYDDWHPADSDAAEAVDFLAERAGSGPVLELGVGTGRIAIPLAARGIEVHGIESSMRMIERLKKKPGGDAITVIQGDMSDVEAAHHAFTMVYTTFNTFWMLLTQEDQIRCLRNAAAHLAAKGVVVIEGSMPDLGTLSQKRSVTPRSLSAASAAIDVTMRDPVAQRIDRQHIIISPSGIRLQPLAFRYVWPSEQDLMARLSGLRLRERVSDWAASPITQQSRGCISVYEKVAES